MLRNKYLIVIGGPTASGKTSLAIQLARHFQTEIISCDSRQFYREMTIGTAKPDNDELATVPHHLINSLSIEDSYSVGDFEREALAILDQLYENKDVAILAGGSGLFINALCFGLDDIPKSTPEIREELEKLHQEKGIHFLQEELKRVDPQYYEEVDLGNPHRIIRALEVFKSSGTPFSSFRKRNAVERLFKPIFIQPSWPRQVLYDRLNQRVDQMVQEGLSHR